MFKISKETKKDIKKIAAVAVDVIIALALLYIIITLLFKTGTAILILVIAFYIRGQIGDVVEYPDLFSDDKS